LRPDGPPLDLANAIRGFAVLKDKAGETHEAQRLWQEAHRIYLSVNATAAIVESAAGLALLARHHGDLSASRGWFEAAVAAAAIAADPDTLGYVRKVEVELAH